MINFPVYKKIKVERYSLYPGDGEGIDIDLTSGPWVVLGVNGLGKSTLLLVLKHTLIGAVRARKPGFAGSTSDMFALNNRLFAVRVGDAAKSAMSTLTIDFGKTTCTVTRRLSDLKLVSAKFRSPVEQSETADEGKYRTLLVKAMGVGRFEDTVRMIDFITFFLEERELLVWSLEAQYELFRAVLSPEAVKLRKLEADIISADSSARNLNANISRIVKRRNKEEDKHQSLAETRARLASADADLETAQAYELEMRHELELAEVRRSDTRISLKQAERKAEELLQEYEEIKYRSLQHAFAGATLNEQYIFLKIISERYCIACGNEALDAATLLEDRRDEDRCLVCGNRRNNVDPLVSTASALNEKAVSVFEKLKKARLTTSQRDERHEEARVHYRETDRALQIARKQADDTKRSVRALQRKLPATDQASLARTEDEITILRREVDAYVRDRTTAENEIASLLQNLSEAMETRRIEFESSFNTLARSFFSEEVRLVYAPRKTRFGQAGEAFEFPAFEVEMTSAATDGDFIRREQSQVSLSQQEYLDLIFRVSFLKVFGNGRGSFVVDGPEGSVDAVFAEKAGDFFASLVPEGEDSTIILACNVVEGEFIPRTLSHYSTLDLRRKRLINLVELGAPTAALRTLKSEYTGKIQDILSAGTGV